MTKGQNVTFLPENWNRRPNKLIWSKCLSLNQLLWPVGRMLFKAEGEGTETATRDELGQGVTPVCIMSLRFQDVRVYTQHPFLYMRFKKYPCLSYATVCVNRYNHTDFPHWKKTKIMTTFYLLCSNVIRSICMDPHEFAVLELRSPPSFIISIYSVWGKWGHHIRNTSVEKGNMENNI